MKRVVLVLWILGLGSLELKAQMQKGTWMLEGSVGLERNIIVYPEVNYPSIPSATYSLHPKAGIFVKDKLAFGASVIIKNSWSKNQEYNENLPGDFRKGSTFNYGGGLFLRKYTEINENLSFFGELGSDVSWVRQTLKYNEPFGTDSENISHVFNAQAIIGLQYLISPKVGVHMQTNMLQFQNSNAFAEFGTDRSEFQAGFLINPRFGLTVFI